MATLSTTRLAAFLLAIYSTLFAGPLNAALLVFFLAIRQSHQLGAVVAVVESAALWYAITASIGAAMVIFLLFFHLALSATRQDMATAPVWHGPGKVLLLPCRTSHSRMFPKKHSFSYSYLVVGIPVGFDGNTGGMVSVAAKGKRGCSPWVSTVSPRGWFTVDPADYLERGKPELGLRGKLDDYLRAQGADPAAYPYAYLVTAPCFLAYQFNPVSFWYLYDSDKRLTAMILEVNNTFDERRMYFLTPSPEDGGCRTAYEEEKARCPPRDSSRPHVFKQSWPKDFHVSPFNSRKGSYRVTATDPLSPSAQDTGPVAVTIHLVSTKGHLKMVAKLSSQGAAIDPSTMTRAQKLRFLASWCPVGFLTYPRILQQALRLFAQRRLHIWHKPEALPSTISRRPTATEKHLEPIFRRYLEHLVEHAPTPLTVKYTPTGGIPPPRRTATATTTITTMSSTAAAETPQLELKILSPSFYTCFFTHYHQHPLEAFTHELNTTQTITLSRPDLLPALTGEPKRGDAATAGQPTAICLGHAAAAHSERGFECEFELIRQLRHGGGGWSAMDEYVLACEDEVVRGVYARCVVKLLLADRVALGSVGGLDVMLGVVRAGVALFLEWGVEVVVGWVVSFVYLQR